MDTKEIKIVPPEGYEVDKENSTLECIKFKKKEVIKFIDDLFRPIKGYSIDEYGNLSDIPYDGYQIFYNAYHKGVFATEKQAKSALAMAQLSQIIANDERFGKPITDEEWNNKANLKFVIYRENSKIKTGFLFDYYTFLAFHTESQRDLFLEENEDLIRQYFMLN